MFNGRCFKDGCTSKLHGICRCEGLILFCRDHGLEHVEKPTPKGHQILRCYFKPAEEIKQPIIDKLIELKKDIKNFKIEAITKANEIIKNFTTEFEKYLNQINEAETRCNKIIEILYNGEEVLDIATEDDMENVLKLNVSDIKYKTIWWNISKCSYNAINEAIKNIYKSTFVVSFVPTLENEIESNELSFFRDSTSNFATINLDTFQISSTVTLPTETTIHPYTTSCILPDKTYFYCCNNNSGSGLTFTIDKNKNYKQLQNSKVYHYAGPIFYNNFIYLIGGNSNQAQRYDFKQNVWESIAPLPQGLNFNYSYSAQYRDTILIVGYYIQKVIIYSIPQNSYQEAPNLILNVNCFKLILKGNNRIYVLEKGGRNFESSENSISSWTQVGTNSITANCGLSSIVYYKGFIYFIKHQYQLWKFDLTSKQVSQVTTL